MPVAPTYPGVYVQEVPSGARTIVGVSTSVAAFVGQTKSGPVNQAMRCLSYGDFERTFGGLSASSELSYAVKQFFDNGGSTAWVVRVAKNATAASRILQTEAGTNALKLTAKAAGSQGNAVSIEVDYNTSNPGTTFNLTVTDGESTESFANLAMASVDPRYAVDVINGDSKLVEAARIADGTGLSAATATGAALVDGTALIDVMTVLNDNVRELNVAVDGGDAVHVALNLGEITGTAAAKLDLVCTQIQEQVKPVYASFSASVVDNAIQMTSGTTEASKVRVTPSATNDASAVLGFGPGAAVYVDAAAGMRPAEAPVAGSIEGAVVAAFPADSVDAATHSFLLSLDGEVAVTVDVGTSLTLPASSLTDRLNTVAAKIQSVVRSLRPSKPAYSRFTATVDAKKITLKSGSLAPGSTVAVQANGTDTLASELGLLSPVAQAETRVCALVGGNEDVFDDNAEGLSIYVGSQSEREGIFALDGIDGFNLLCLPGVTNSGVLASAVKYCEDNRAFLIADAPKGKNPRQIEDLISGTALPKSDHAAVYYPWITIQDPLTGRPRTCAPCGTMAGLYARTDNARGVWKAPAGTESTLNGVVGLDYVMTDGEQGTLNPLGVNCLRQFPVISTVAWGARTLRGADQLVSEYKYVPVRRLALYMEESLFRGLKWVVFEPNDEPLWANIRMNVNAFMNNLFRQGAFAGSTPNEAYFVRCDSQTTTPADQNLGVVNIWVGFAPLKPAEFVILNIQQIAQIAE